MWWLSPKFWIAVIVAVVIGFTSYTSYKVGQQSVQSKWDKDKLVKAEQALLAEQEARKKEQHLVAAKQKAEERYVQEKRKAASAAIATSNELNRLRDTLSSTTTSAVASTSPRVNDSSKERELLGQCAATLTGMAAEADQLAATVSGLQFYIKTVVLNK